MTGPTDDQPTDEDRAAAAFGAWRERIDAGEDVPLDDVLRAHPDLAGPIRRQFAAMRHVERVLRGEAAAAPGDSLPAGLVGRTLGRWTLRSVLGSGGMGTVFLAEDGDARAAVKVLHAHLLGRQGFVERFLRESEIGRRVRHEGVVATLDAGAAELDGGAVHYLVMEHVEGRTLRALLDDLGRVPEALCRHLGRETARALAAVHEAGAVHRDLKPENVIVTGAHTVKVMDLGVARLRDEVARLSQTGAFVGSVQYGSPEQFHDASGVDARADLFALGLVLYELATGVHPFRADGFHAVVRRILDETPRPAAELNPQLSPFFEVVVATLLAKDRERRFASAEELAAVLDQGEESSWWRERAQAIRAATRRPLRRIRVPRETAVYGRDAELARLDGLFGRAKAGDGQVVFLVGEAGIGKSRLVDEFVGRLAQSGEDVHFLFGSYPPGGAATVSGALTAAYREQLGDDEAAARSVLPQTPLLAPAFAAHLRGDLVPAGAQALTKESLRTVFVHATRALAAERPTVVLVDDLHFAPDEGRALFAALAHAVPEHRVLLVGAARPTLDPKWLGEVERLPHATRLPVGRLGAKDLVLLLRDTLKSEHLAEELSARIAVKSDGNPFFVFEILRGLREGQFITKRSDGTWATTKEIREIVVPSSVVELVQARVSDLSRADRNVLEVAACLGFEFDPALVGDVLGMERIPVLQALGAVEKSHRLVRSAGRRFAFDHHQVMEVLYGGLSEPLREEYHAAVGTALEARSGAASRDPNELDGALCADLVDHLLKGGRGPRAVRYLDAALAHLEARHRVDAAVRLIDRALAVPGLVAGVRRAKLLHWKAGRLDVLGVSRDGGRRELEEAMAIADAEGELALRAKMRVQMGAHLFRLARHEEALACLEPALALAREAGDGSCERAAMGNVGICHLMLGRLDEARGWAERCIAQSAEAGDELTEARALDNLGLVELNAGRVARALETFHRAMALSARIGARTGEINASGNLAHVYKTLGRFDEARRYGEQALAGCREIGYRHAEAGVTGNLGILAEVVGFLDEALERTRRYVRLSEELSDWVSESLAVGNLALFLMYVGRFDASADSAERCRALAREKGAKSEESYALRVLAELAAEQGDFERADRLFDEAAALRRAIGETAEAAETLRTHGAWRLHRGQVDAARAAFAEAIEASRGFEHPGVEVLAAAGLATIPGGDVANALSLHAQHGPRLEHRVAMETRHLLWKATGDVAHLAEAKRLADHFVAHAPAEDRAAMGTKLRLHREIAAAARASGL